MYRECRHIMPTGRKCKSPALNGHPFCHFHSTLSHHAQDGLRAQKEPLILPSLEDFSGIQIAVAQVLNALGSGRLTSKQAGLYLYGLQIASNLAARAQKDLPARDDIVRNLACDNLGNIIAEEVTVCEPPRDCLHCTKRNTCARFTDYEDEVEELEEQIEEQEEEEEEQEQDDESEEEDDEEADEDEEVEDDEDAEESILAELQAHAAGQPRRQIKSTRCHPERRGILHRSEGPAFCVRNKEESILEKLQAHAGHPQGAGAFRRLRVNSNHPPVFKEHDFSRAVGAKNECRLFTPGINALPATGN